MAVLLALTFMASSIVQPPALKAQAQTAPVSQGFNIDAGDLRFIFHAIQIGQAHAAGGNLVGPGPNQVSLFGNSDPQLPLGLRTVDGSFNNLVPGQTHFGAADLLFPRLLTPSFKPAEAGTSYAQTAPGNLVIDSQPRLISNLIVDQSATNPAAVAANANPCGSGGFVCGGGGTEDPTTHTLFIPNITPDFGLSAPFNVMFAFFGQFFDHGLDLVTKGGGTVSVPLKADDPLIAGADGLFGTADDLPVAQRFMFVTRGTNMGTGANLQNGQNTTTPWVDQNQTYTSHPSHQVFLREYILTAGRPIPTGKVADGGFCAARPTGIPGDSICNIANWNQVKAQASTRLGIRLLDQDVFDVPMLLTDPYGHFKPGTNGFPQIMLTGGGLLQGNPTANAGAGVAIPANAIRTGHAFLNDIAHAAAPNPGLLPDVDTVAGTSLSQAPAGRYDDELLGLHMITGDGRGNENIALTTMHQIFHSEHNRLVADIDRLINTPGFLTAAEVTAWKALDVPSGWGYGERLFQAARFCTEMQYQHLVFEEFARKIQPLINPFLGGITSINPAISAEFAHVVYRLGHSMLPEVLTRINADDVTANDIRLFDGFLNPASFNDSGVPCSPFPTPACVAVATTTGGVTTIAGRVPMNAAQAAGSIVRGLSRSVANELDEFISSSVRNTLVGLPLDLAAVNIARGRSEGIPGLNVARRQFYDATQDAAVQPYTNWFEFGLNLKHSESLINFVAAYGTAANIVNATALPAGCLPQNCTTSLIAAKRAAAAVHVLANDAFMFQSATSSGVDNVDFWVGGLAERQAVFGGLLGSTFNFVFEKQLENLQDGDRFYYLQRTDGLNLRFQLEGNSLAELVRRNTDSAGGMDIIFNTADVIISFSQITNNVFDSGDGTTVLTLPDGMKMFLDPLHRGKNIVFNGGPGVDKFRADVGDDTLYGNDGADRLDGWEGNDTLHGGNGDDILFGGNGDDVIKGGSGHDAMNSGPGFGGDLLIGGEGNDFLLGGNDGVEHFGGAGNDIIIDGDTRTEGAFGGTGDDWIEGGDGHDGGLFGDNGNVFDLTAGLDPVGGDDVINGDPGQDGYFGEGGDDIFLQSEGSNKMFGDYGFDWVTQRAWPFPGDIELSLLALPNAPVNFNDLRNKYRFVDGASGWDLNDHVRGSNSVLCDPAAAEIAECLVIGMELTAAGAAKITGLTEMMGPTGFNQSLTAAAIPGIKGVGFMGGDILLGGGGSDVLEGKLGDDLIDGDRWLNVQLQAKMNNGSIKRVNSARDLIDDVFSDPQRLNPGNITIKREMMFKSSATDVDTAVFNFPRIEYNIDVNPNGTVTVTHNPPTPAGIPFAEGTDTLRGIERLQFTEDPPAPSIASGGGTSATTSIGATVVGLTDSAAIAALTERSLAVTLSFATSSAANEGRVLSQSPTAGTVATGTTVALVIGSGPVVATNVLVPNVVGLLLGTPGTPGPARTGITGAGLVVGTVTSVADASPLDTVVSTSPVSSTSVVSGSAVNVARSTGVAPVLVLVPDVVGQVQATAQANIAAATLTSSIVTATSATVAAGSVISTSPVAGSSVATGSNVVLTISLGPAAPVTVLVPNVVGQAQATAQANIAAVGLTASLVTATSATVAAGNVISTSPVAGTSVATGSNVVLTISLGPAAPVTVPVPNVVGQAQATAQANIAAAGLTSSIVTANSATVAAGNVISTSPVAATVVLVGSNVVLTVSLGPVVIVTVPVPNVVGQVQATAQANITAAGLTSSVVTANSATVAAGLVISTSPVAATSVAVGSNVVLTVSLGPAAVGLPAPFVTQDVGAVGVAGSATAVGGLFSVTGSGADIFDAVDAFRYVYQPLAADGQIVARVVTQQNTDPWAKSGVMIRENLTAGSRNAMVAVTPGNGVEFQRRTATGGLSTFTPDGGAAAPTWVKLVRTGSTITAFSSPNGVTYTLIGTDTIAVAGSVFIGLAVSSHNNAVTNLSTFDNVTVGVIAPPPPPPPPPPPGPLAPWLATDIGTVGVAGSTTLAGGLFTVNGSGNDIWDAADAFHYVYQPLAADGTITARVVTQQNTDPWAKSGVMIRENLTAGSRNAMVAVTPGNGVEFQRRTAPSGASTFTAGPATSAPIWVRLVRTGTTITASSSADGVTFTPIGTDTIPAGSVFVGLAVSSHNNAVTNVTTFDNVVKVP